MNRRQFLATTSAAAAIAAFATALAPHSAAAQPAARKKGVLLMNRIGPSTSNLYVANADGSGERKLLANPVFEYNARFSADGQSLVFTSERNGDGNSDVFRCRPDGAGI